LALGYLLGKRIASGIFNSTWHPVLAAALGNLVLFIIAWGVSRIPCVGWFPVFMSLLFGLGMVIATLFGTFSYPRSASKEEEEQQIILFPKGKPEEGVFPTGEEPKNAKNALTDALAEDQSDSPEEGLSKIDAPPAMPVVDVVAKPEVPIETLNLGTHINTVLIDADLTTVQAVLDKLESGEDALLLIDGFDDHSLTALKKALQASGYKIP